MLLVQSVVATNALINDLSGGIVLKSEPVILEGLSANIPLATYGFPGEKDELDLDLPSEGFSSIPEAIEDILRGKMVVVVDDEDRENEGDLIMAASNQKSLQSHGFLHEAWNWNTLCEHDVRRFGEVAASPDGKPQRK